MTSKELMENTVKVLDNKLAEDIVVIDVSEKSSFADYLVLASGKNARQVVALSDDVEDAMAKEGQLPKSIEGKNASGWILMDFGDIIVNIFDKDTREKYSIERVWGDCPIVSYGEGEVE